jgi:hypothetical protein
MHLATEKVIPMVKNESEKATRDMIPRYMMPAIIKSIMGLLLSLPGNVCKIKSKESARDLNQADYFIIHLSLWIIFLTPNGSEP